jgi:hypothetical protein
MARKFGGGRPVSVDASEVSEKLAVMIRDSNVIGSVALRKALQVLRKRSRLITPVESGSLKRSISYQIKRGVKGRLYTRSLDYVATHKGKARKRNVLDYAIVVHEDLSAKHEPGAQAKFIEQPVHELAASGELLAIVAGAVRDSLKKLAGKGRVKIRSPLSGVVNLEVDEE